MSGGPKCRADLHLHSRHSTRAAEWLLRKLEFPASMSEPRKLYDGLRAAGMDFVTLTDHDTIAGCLELAELPGFVFGEEVTALFPEDECKVHILVWGLDERQHREIQSLRENIYDLQRFLAAEGLPHAVAHPLHSPNEKLTELHAQKLVLLFQCFEACNGRYPALLSEAWRWSLERLTPRAIEEFSARTGLLPTHPEPWKKHLVGGSDDHGGLQAGRAWTETPGAASAAEFLEHLRAGRCAPGGQDGEPLATAHGTYKTAYEFLKKKFPVRPGTPGAHLLEKAFSRFMEGRNPTEFTLGEKLAFLAQGLASGKIFELAIGSQTTIWKELAAHFSKPETRASLERAAAGAGAPERRAFLMANLAASQLGYRLFTQFIAQISSGRVVESLQTLSPLAIILALLSPYLQALRLPRRRTLRAVCRSLAGAVPPCLEDSRRAWFTDTIQDVNGVTTTIRKMAAAAAAAGHEVEVIVSCESSLQLGIPLKNFAPVGTFALPEYELQSLSFPPVLHMLDDLITRRFTHVIVSTPGPVGLAGLYAAKALGLPSAGIYHTDFPQYVGILTDDAFLETLTWDYMHWFYSQFDLVLVNSEAYRRQWAARGIPEEKLKILPRGLDIEMFHPCKRDPTFWPARGLRPGEAAMLYVGRISKEKNLELLAQAARRLQAEGVPARPIFVGDGPFLEELRRLLPGAIFTGVLRGEQLAAAYASASFFVFPSTTDTFGNVILEAQASGLPVIVSDAGGPCELVASGKDGLVVPAMDAAALAAAAAALTRDPARRANMGRAARAKVESRDWSRAAARLWQMLEAEAG